MLRNVPRRPRWTAPLRVRAAKRTFRAACARRRARQYIGRTVDAEVLQRGSGQAGGIALLTDHNDLKLVVGDRQPRVATRIKSPLQDIALDHQSPGQRTFGLSLRCRPNVHHHSTRTPGIRRLGWRESRNPCPRRFEHLLDGLATASGLAVWSSNRTQQLTPTSCEFAIWSASPCASY
jgi:hypothetical protein